MLTSAASAAGTTTVQGSLNSTASTTFRVEVFSNTSCDTSLSGEGQFFHGAQDVTTDGSGNASVNAAVLEIPLSRFITATATNQTTGDTSEFSTCIQETGANTNFVVNSSADASDADLTNPLCDDGAGNCTLRAAIEQANSNPSADAISFNVGGGGAQTISPASALPAIIHPVSIDGTTQPGFACSPLIE